MPRVTAEEGRPIMHLPWRRARADATQQLDAGFEPVQRRRSASACHPSASPPVELHKVGGAWGEEWLAAVTFNSPEGESS